MLILWGPFFQEDATPKKINVNTASKEELVSELGLRPQVADRLIRIRAGKPLGSAEELIEVDGIGPATAERIAGMENVVFEISEGGGSGARAEASADDGILPDGTITGSGGVNEKGEFEGGFKVDIGKLLNALSKSSKDRDWKKIAKAIRKWGRFTGAIIEKLIEPLPEGRDKERIRRKARELKEKLEELEDAIRDGDEEAAEEAADEIEDIIDDLEDLLEDAGIDLPTGD